MRGITWLGVVLAFLVCADVRAEYQAGVAQVDITPDYPVRLSGFGFRRTESEGVTQKIWAKALAISDGANGPAVILCVDNVGIPDAISRDVGQRLKSKTGLDPSRLAVTCTHTHTAPMLTNVVPTLFGQPIPPDQQQRIDRYTRELTDKIEQAAIDALNSLRPGKLEFGTGAVGFAINRRTPGGPVDHDLPVLAVRDPNGKLRAVYFSYACHCVTLSHNKISGDWAGYAMEVIARAHPGAVALASIGCGADQNPSSNPVGDRVEVAQAQAQQLAHQVEQILKQELTPLTQPIEARLGSIDLPFDKPPTREQLTETAKKDDYAGYHARVQLAKLDRGEKLATAITYAIQTWNFGDQLAMVFLPGEVVVDYSLRLKRDYDRTRLWINAYSNDAPCYIPSERILREGGYEGGGAMIFYDRPTRLAPGLEDKIVAEVHRQLPQTFLAPKGTEGVAPRTPEASRRSIRTKPDLQVELVACEPLVASPIAIDWSADGRLWVCEMFDYPTGADQNWAPGGQVKVLTDTDHDGRYDAAQTFLENVPFPTGVTAWGKGVLVCAAPDILYAQDTDGDGKADKIEKVFTGFATANYQARVNSLSLGLDNWIYGANGLLGGDITDTAGKSVDIRNHDFRFRPPAGPMEVATGLTQQGRIRDDWGRWFGCDNSRALLFYPHEERYLRRNPHITAPAPIVAPTGDFDVGRVYPISRTLERFNDPDNAGRMTSACGIGIYRDTLLGTQYAGNAFTAEPVHNLVHRMLLLEDDDGVAISRRRGADERESEFLASTDNWFRPVQLRTGPDGALYVVDMYRFLIEHPRWIPPQRLAQLDVRAGAGMGRIYRVRPKNKPLRELRDLTKLAASDVALALDSPNGTERDRVHAELLVRRDQKAVPLLQKLASDASLPQVRLQALCLLEGLDALTPQRIVSALHDPDAHVRQQAVRLCEPLLRDQVDGQVADALLALADDPSRLVRCQVAYTLGEWPDPRAARALAKLASASPEDPQLCAAVLSSSSRHCGVVLEAIMKLPGTSKTRNQWIPPLIATAAASSDEALVSQALGAVLSGADSGDAVTAGTFDAMAALLDALERRRTAVPDLGDRLSRLTNAARRCAVDPAAAEDVRVASLRVLGRGQVDPDELKLLCDLATSSESDKVRAAAIASLKRQSNPQVAATLLSRWQQLSPASRGDIVTLLLGRDVWTATLLEAVKKHKVQPNEIALGERQRLLESENHEIRKLASQVFPSPAKSQNREELLQRYAAINTLTGTASRGAELFSKNCAACHALNGIGHEVGPDLSALRNKPADYFAKNILDPSAVVEPRFVNYVVDLADGRTLAGVIKSETSSSLTLATGGAGAASATEILPRADIRSIRATSSSMMPDGFEAALPPEQMADLIAFIKSGRSPKKLPGNSPRLVEAQQDAPLLLRAADAEIEGGAITFETHFSNIGYWSGRDDQAAWTIRVNRPGEYLVWIDYACASDSAGNVLAVEAGDQKITATLAATGADWSRYRQIQIGKLNLQAGQQRIVLRPDGDVRGALMDLRTVALASAGVQITWPAATSPAPEDELLRDPESLARLILDPSKPPAAREAAINANPQFAAELIVQMTRDLEPGKPVEYERIPWIWRVAIASGKANDAEQIRKVLNASLPQLDAPLHHWQAVVIGGGIINGISQRDLWPAERSAQIIGNDRALESRWNRSLDLASAMADDEAVPTGTRYDALRMLGVQPWEKRGAQLGKYLAAKAHAELQMGAVSGLADVHSAPAAHALIDALGGLTEGNRKLALDALLRDVSRCLLLLQAVHEKKVDSAMLGEDRIQKLRQHQDPEVRRRADSLFAQK